MAFFTKEGKYGDKELRIGRFVSALILSLLVLFLFFASWTIVGAGERGVIVTFGKVSDTIYNEGLHFKKPFADKIIRMNVQIQKAVETSQSASADLQVVSTTVAVNYKLKPDSVASVYQTMRKSYVDRVIDPSIQESVKSATSKYTAEQLVTDRASVRDEISLNITNKLTQYGIAVSDVNIINFQFSKSFDEAIERKVTAEQEALASKNKLEQVKFEAQQRIEDARGKAEALKLNSLAKAEAIEIESDALAKNKDIIQLRYIEKWDGKLPTVSSEGAGMLISIDK